MPGATIERSALLHLYESVYANLDEVVWNEHNVPVEMMEFYNQQLGIKGQSNVRDLIVSGFGYAADKREGRPSQTDTIYEVGSKLYTPVVSSLEYIVTEEAVWDNKYMMLKEAFTELAKSFKATKEIKGAVPFNTAFSSTTSADGVALCSTAHLLQPSGATGQNTLSTAADLSVTSAQLCINDIADTVNDRGILTGLRAGRLVIPQELEWLAHEIFKSMGRSDTANRADNAFMMIPKYKGMEIITKIWLTDADAYFFLPASNSDHGLKYKEWWPFKTAGDIEFSTGNLKYKASERYVFDVTKWQGIFGVPGV